MDKPKYLYHGARSKHEMLEPRKGIGYGDTDNEYGVYAVSEIELAIPFAFSYSPAGDGATFSVDTLKNPPVIVLENADIDWTKSGYVYKVKSDTFEMVDSQQWISRTPVKPVEILDVCPENFREWIVYK